MTSILYFLGHCLHRFLFSTDEVTSGQGGDVVVQARAFYGSSKKNTAADTTGNYFIM